MTGRANDNPQPASKIVLYQTEDGRNRVEVRLEDESVWLTQNLMAELCQTTQQNVSLHIRNIYKEGELDPGATHKDFLSVRQEGSRKVRRRLEYYNLDLIIAVGYRVKSPVATRLRCNWMIQRRSRSSSGCGPGMVNHGTSLRRHRPGLPPLMVLILKSGAEEIRTPDPHVANVVLYQLSYRPICARKTGAEYRRGGGMHASAFRPRPGAPALPRARGA
jgi:hypothetical protein